MAIRRVSDLQNVTAINEDASLSDCLLEVSYETNNDTGRKYHSAYMKGEYLADQISSSIYPNLYDDLYDDLYNILKTYIDNNNNKLSIEVVDRLPSPVNPDVFHFI